jgi:hypothetical protein
MSSATAGRSHATLVQRRCDGAERGRARGLYLAHDGQHVGGEGVRGLPVCRNALGLRVGQIGPVPQVATATRCTPVNPGYSLNPGGGRPEEEAAACLLDRRRRRCVQQNA